MLIVDMPMPKDGGCHIAVDWDGHSFVCPIKRKTCDYFFSNKRPDWCPIKGELVLCSECKQYEKFDGYCKKFGMLFPKDNPCIDGEKPNRTEWNGTAHDVDNIIEILKGLV